jgi:hypothetical protein
MICDSTLIDIVSVVRILFNAHGRNVVHGMVMKTVVRNSSSLPGNACWRCGGNVR